MTYEIASEANQKLRGGYYTPPELANFLARWAINDAQEEVLEPSCGDGALLTSAARRLMELGAKTSSIAQQLQGIELYSSEALVACQKLEELGIEGGNCVSVGDFFEYDDQEWGIIGKKFDVVVGNPPFLRYQNFPADQRDRAFRIMETAGLKPSRLTNSWLTFLVAASLRLKDRGRLAMVIPAELLQVKYAAETRAFLARHFANITIVCFRQLVFEGVLQEVVLLLAEKSAIAQGGINVIELEDASELEDYRVEALAPENFKQLDHASEKWTQYFLEKSEIQFLRELENHPKLRQFKEFGSVDVGVVTGNNGFFVLNRDQVQELQLSDVVVPLAGRTVQLPGLNYSQEDWSLHQREGFACHLLDLPSALPSAAAAAYVIQGETAEVHKGYKCSIRKPWHIVPKAWQPDAFLFRQIYRYPKLVSNEAGATSTDTIHRVRFHQPEHTKQWTASFLNSLTFAFSEVFGRSYGGGVLELEPTEAERMPVPFFEDAQLPFDALDALERANDIEAILDLVDGELLVERLGLTWAQVHVLRGIWQKLSQRRLTRGNKKKLS